MRRVSLIASSECALHHLLMSTRRQSLQAATVVEHITQTLQYALHQRLSSSTVRQILQFSERVTPATAVVEHADPVLARLASESVCFPLPVDMVREIWSLWILSHRRQIELRSVPGAHGAQWGVGEEGGGSAMPVLYTAPRPEVMHTTSAFAVSAEPARVEYRELALKGTDFDQVAWLPPKDCSLRSCAALPWF